MAGFPAQVAPRVGEWRGAGGVAMDWGLAKLRKERRCWETAGGSSWEPLARRRERDAAEAIRRSSSQLSPTSQSAYTSTVSQSNLSAILMCFCLVSKLSLTYSARGWSALPPHRPAGIPEPRRLTSTPTRSLNAC